MFLWKAFLDSNQQGPASVCEASPWAVICLGRSGDSKKVLQIEYMLFTPYSTSDESLSLPGGKWDFAPRKVRVSSEETSSSQKGPKKGHFTGAPGAGK